MWVFILQEGWRFSLKFKSLPPSVSELPPIPTPPTIYKQPVEIKQKCGYSCARLCGRGVIDPLILYLGIKYSNPYARLCGRGVIDPLILYLGTKYSYSCARLCGRGVIDPLILYLGTKYSYSCARICGRGIKYPLILCFLNEVIPLCIDSIYSFYYIYLNKSLSGPKVSLDAQEEENYFSPVSHMTTIPSPSRQ